MEKKEENGIKDKHWLITKIGNEKQMNEKRYFSDNICMKRYLKSCKRRKKKKREKERMRYIKDHKQVVDMIIKEISIHSKLDSFYWEKGRRLSGVRLIG